MYSSRILLNQTQIEAINWKNYGRNETGLCDLSRNDLLISISALKDLFHLENLDQEPRYTREGIRYGKAFYNALKMKILDSLPGGTDSRDNLIISPQYAVAVKNGQIRLYPTMPPHVAPCEIYHAAIDHPSLEASNVDHIAVAEHAYEAFISTRGARAMHRRGVMLTIHQVKFYRLTV